MGHNNAIDFQNGWFLKPYFLIITLASLRAVFSVLYCFCTHGFASFDATWWCCLQDVSYWQPVLHQNSMNASLSIVQIIIKNLKDLLPFLCTEFKTNPEQNVSMGVGGWGGWWIKEWGRYVREKKNHREVKGDKKWNRSGLKREQGRDKTWQIREHQGKELSQGRGEVKKKTSDSSMAGSDRV